MPQRPTTVRLGAAGNSDWIPLNAYSDSFGVGLGVKLSSNGNLTANVQHTFDDIYLETLCPLARSGTSLSVTKTNHGLSANDWVQIDDTIWAGQYAVASITDQNTFVVTVANSGATSGLGRVKTARVFPHVVLTSLTASADSNYSAPPKATRLNVSVYAAGYVDFTVIPGGK